MRAYVVIPAARQAEANQIVVDDWGGENERITFNVPLATIGNPTVTVAYWCHGRLFPAMVPTLQKLAALPGAIRWYRVDLADNLISTNSPSAQARIGQPFSSGDVLADLGLVRA